jgi:hypothetical protein
MKTITQLILAGIILILGYLLVDSVMKPIRFKQKQQKRYEATIERLIDIRKSQKAYKSKYGKYTGSFDTLINFVETDSFDVVKAIGQIPDTLTEEQAARKGLIERDTTKISVLDSLFGIDYAADSMRYVPYTNGATFKLGAGTVKTESEVKVKVFRASVHNDVLLKGLDRQLVINLNEEKKEMTGFAGLKVGSLEKATNNAGNWE